MRQVGDFEYPENLRQQERKAKKIQWISLVYLITAIIMMAAVMSSSQAMKTAWIEDILSLVPPISYIISSGIYTLPANESFPYGYHRVSTIAFLISAVALCGIGFILFGDSVVKLIRAEHATISSVMVGSKQVWLGWIMIIVMVYSTVPTMILGKMKQPLSHDLSEKNLYTDAMMNRANWLTGIAAIIGIIGIGIGWWWADPVAAIIICADILKDGFKNLKQSVFDLMNEVPTKIGSDERDPLFDLVEETVRKEKWVLKSDIRFREEGHVYFGEVFLVPEGTERATERTTALRDKLLKLHWKIFDVTIMLEKDL